MSDKGQLISLKFFRRNIGRVPFRNVNLRNIFEVPKIKPFFKMTTDASSPSEWPSFEEMTAGLTSKSSSLPEVTMPEIEVGEAVTSTPEGGPYGLEPELSMMDYAWNEDNIEIDFMTGRPTKTESCAFSRFGELHFCPR